MDITKFLGLVSDLLVLEIVNQKMSDELSDTIKIFPYFPAATCKRQVYIFKKENAEKIQKASLGMNCKFYTDVDAYRFLLIWYVGGQNESKYLQDTYNSKTIKTYLETFQEILKCNNKPEEIEQRISDIKTRQSGNEARLREITALKESASEDQRVVLKNEVGRIQSNNGWLKEKLRSYEQLSPMIPNYMLEDYQKFNSYLNYIIQSVQEDSKFLFSAKQSDVIESKSRGEVSFWSHSVANLNANPDLASLTLKQRRGFLEEKADATIQMRTTMPSPLALGKPAIDIDGICL